ncbi:MAG: hypothetical protein ABWY62_05855 [Acidimicrobiia bacterium]
MVWLRVLIGALIALAVAIAVVPLAVLADLKDGGSGWGLCPQGLAVCRTGYFAGFELLLGVVVALGAVLLAIHLCVRALRRIERQQAARAFVASQQQAWLRQQQTWQQREASWATQSAIAAPPQSGIAAPPQSGIAASPQSGIAAGRRSGIAAAQPSGSPDGGAATPSDQGS